MDNPNDAPDGHEIDDDLISIPLRLSLRLDEIETLVEEALWENDEVYDVEIESTRMESRDGSPILQIDVIVSVESGMISAYIAESGTLAQATLSFLPVE